MTGRPSIAGRGWRGLALAFLLALHYSVLPSAAQLPLPPAVDDQPIHDFARIIDDASARELVRRIDSLKRATGDVIMVATVPTFQPYADIKEYAVKMFENRGKSIGDRTKDNGLLIVVAVNDRKVGIEVGYQLEPLVTDGFAGETIREYIAPAFRRQQYGEGLVAGTTRIINRIAEQRGVNLTDMPATPAPEPAAQRRRSGNRFPVGLAVIIFVLILRAMAGRTRRRRRYWGGGPWSGWNSGVGPFGGGGGFGGFGGGFGGFGGGGGGGGGGGWGGLGGGRSGGGGASGGW